MIIIVIIKTSLKKPHSITQQYFTSFNNNTSFNNCLTILLGVNSIAKRALEYIKEKKLGKSQKEELLKLAETMNYLGLTDEARLQSVTIGEINCVHSEEISEHGIEMLAQKFGIKSESASFNPGILYAYIYVRVT